MSTESILERMDVRLDGIERWQAKSDERWKMLTQHDTMLHGPPGNGKRPGLMTRTAANEDAIKKIEVGRERRAAREWGIVAALLILAVTTIVGMVCG